MEVKQVAERMATWLLEKARAGEACPPNVVQSAVKVLKVSRRMAAAAAKELRQAKRYKYNPVNGIGSIDGVGFFLRSQPSDVDRIKDILRRRFPQVIDLRTVTDENNVARGLPAKLLCGNEVVPWEQAVAMAAEEETKIQDTLAGRSQRVRINQPQPAAA